MKSQLEIEIRHLYDDSNRLELEAKYDANIDQFVKNYMTVRTEYHIQRKKMSSWNAQGELKI